MKETVEQIERAHREVAARQVEAGQAWGVLLRRVYEAPADEVWAALTTPERIGAWFLPVSGDLRAGGRYRLEGHAGGEILECEAPRRFKVTWLYGPDPGFSELEVRLSEDGGKRTRFTLEHVSAVPEEFWARYGPGAVGIGWDGLGLALALHLAGRGLSREEAEAWQTSDEAREFFRRSAEAWGAAYAAGGAGPETVEATTRASVAAYTGEEAG